MSGCRAPDSTQRADAGNLKTKVVRIGYQSSGDLTQAKGTLEKRLAPLSVSVQWYKFSAGPPLLEALNVGALDLGPTGETPPIFAQAAGAPLVYVANYPAQNREILAIVVPKESLIRRVADLKGKKVTFVEASAAQFLLVKALEEAGLQYRDVKAIDLPPADAGSALARGSVDAWVAWDPYLLVAQKSGKFRVLRDATGIPTPGAYYLASRAFADQNPEVLKIVLDEVAKVGQWGNANPREAAQLLAKQVQLDIGTLEELIKRRRYGLRAIDNEVIATQQQIADLYYQLGLLPKRVDIRQATLTPEQYAKLTPEAILR
ncbi:MAG: aliphatic sulfonate ABC transporter substrate-binding protein [Aphanocapsa lilacina HA4352-LM1]|nr:aliphatic sulfonate ABC transporter substrate-binding protein [Aphanocapsa lilacina HA4352-LM1]